MADRGHAPHIVRLGLPDNFVEHGTVDELRQIVGLDRESIKRSIIKLADEKVEDGKEAEK